MHSKDNKVCSHLFYPCFCFKDSVLLRHKVEREIKRIRRKLDSIARNKDNYGLANGIAAEVSLLRQKTSSGVNVIEAYGCEIDRDIIVSKMSNENSHNEIGVPVISIVGMGELGKTTLVQLVLHDKNIVKHFEKMM
ncbi:hypothetical protein GIB67_026763 [Kingdonia uniflora]|uniref:NB-ARC domain-containing protein n=1 Tax=Kingdonia uniflora TaxID=39325 RepID=A0A7J7MHG6_9MAGN|nr:hypothetical protein GIB67_026763 [Kingdonia uniflora]